MSAATNPPPRPGVGDVWAELMEVERDSVLRAIYNDRRALGLRRYGTPLQRDNGRDTPLDLREELLDGMAYARSIGDHFTVFWLRVLLKRRLRLEKAAAAAARL